MKLKYVKLFEEFNNSELESKILNCNDWDDFIKILKSVYGNSVPLYHATNLKNSKIIDKEGIKLVDGRNYKNLADSPIIYFQIGKSDYVSDYRPILYRYDAPIEVLAKYAYIDSDKISSREDTLKYLVDNGYDLDEYEELPSDIKDLISYCVEYGFKLNGMEIYLQNIDNDSDFPTIIPKKIE